MPFAAGVPALELIVGQKLHVGPPAYPVRVPVAGRGRQHSANKSDQQDSWSHWAFFSVSSAFFVLAVLKSSFFARRYTIKGRPQRGGAAGEKARGQSYKGQRQRREELR